MAVTIIGGGGASSGSSNDQSTSFGGSSDSDLVSIVADADAGKVDLVKDLGWQVGDRRRVSLSSMSATYTDESQSAQEVVFVLYNKGGYKLLDGSECHFVLGLENYLSTNGKMNDSNIGSWKNCGRRKWCNEIFKNAIPSSIRGIFKQFKCYTYDYSENAVVMTEDYFTLPSSVNLFGVHAYNNSAEDEYQVPLAYFAGTGRRIRTLGQTASLSNGAGANGWLRSPYSSDSFVYVGYGGNAYDYAAPSAYGLAPLGCL